MWDRYLSSLRCWKVRKSSCIWLKWSKYVLGNLIQAPTFGSRVKNSLCCYHVVYERVSTKWAFCAHRDREQVYDPRGWYNLCSSTLSLATETRPTILVKSDAKLNRHLCVLLASYYASLLAIPNPLSMVLDFASFPSWVKGFSHIVMLIFMGGNWWEFKERF